jgi:hypothetical protein
MAACCFSKEIYANLRNLSTNRKKGIFLGSFAFVELKRFGVEANKKNTKGRVKPIMKVNDKNVDLDPRPYLSFDGRWRYS